MRNDARFTFRDIGIPIVFLGLISAGLAFNAKAPSQAIITQSGIASAMVAEPKTISDGFPVGVKLTRYNVSQNKSIAFWSGKPITTFCKNAGFPSRQIRCRDTVSPFNLNAMGKQQTIDLGTEYTVS